MPETVAVRDGAVLVHLSPQSRYRRFLTPMSRLSPRLLRYLTEVDHHDHEALVAESPEGDPVGVARIIRLTDNPDTRRLHLPRARRRTHSAH